MTNEFRLETARLVLRRFQLADSDAYFALNAVPDTSWLDPQTWQSQLPGRLLICLSDHTPLGFVGLRYLPSLNCIDIGYRLLPSQQGKGYAGEAVVALLNHARAQPHWPEVIAVIHPDNHASITLAQRAGLRYRDEVWIAELSLTLGRYA